MNRCEDYPACGHGPAPYGDDGGCPDEQGRFDCVLCRVTMPKGARSAICEDCRTRRYDERDELGMSDQDRYDEEWDR